MSDRPCRVELCPRDERRPHGFCDAHLLSHLRARCAAYGCMSWILPSGGRTRCFKHTGRVARSHASKSKAEAREQVRRVHASFACSGEDGYGSSILGEQTALADVRIGSSAKTRVDR